MKCYNEQHHVRRKAQKTPAKNFLRFTIERNHINAIAMLNKSSNLETIASENSSRAQNS